MAKVIRQKVTFRKAAPAQLWRAFMDNATHGKICGGRAVIGKKPGAKWSAYDGYCFGTQLVLEKNRRIVQTWRAADWPKDQLSVLVLEFAPRGEGGVLTMAHHGVPKKFVAEISAGWKEFYWTPMKKLFGE